MGRMVIWLLVIGLLVGVAYAATTNRYQSFMEGSTQVRRDRWTGAVQVWGCTAYEFRGGETPYFPMAADSNTDKPCVRYGWVTRK